VRAIPGQFKSRIDEIARVDLGVPPASFARLCFGTAHAPEEMMDDPEVPGGLNLAERIRRLAHGRSTLDVAQFQFIGLDEIRRTYAERWSEKRERVGRVARHFISRRIAPDDVLVAGADGFLLVFGGVTGFLAEAAARQISRELNAFFLGDPELGGVQVEAQSAAMTVDDFTAAFGEMIAQARPQDSRPEHALADLPMGYVPVWDAQRGALATYFITPLDPATRQPLDWDQHSHRHADMDELKLNQSELAMRRLFAGEGRALMGVAVHVTTLNSPQGFARVAQAMGRFDRRLARYRILRVSCVDPGYPRIYLEDALRALRPLADRVAIGLNWMESDVASVVKLQPAAIGFTVPARTLGPVTARNDVYGRIAAAVELAKAHGVKVGVEGDLHPEHAVRFMQDGVDYVCSPRIWPVQLALPAAEAWPATRLVTMAQQADKMTAA
jgi:hypothetical protein